MRVLVAAGFLALLLGACTTTEQRIGGAGAGAAAGAVVAGPLGAVVGGVAGAATGPGVGRAVGVRQAKGKRTRTARRVRR
ncbi:MAG TPA: hypothetical protein VM434_06160 [Beijerinckiaceae bacterium]|nr:hypothetical protein [Beijerinckiaceae bacterium]